MQDSYNQKLVDDASRIADTALSYFRRQGVSLDEQPRIKYCTEPHAIRPNAMAAVRQDAETTKASVAAHARSFGKMLYKGLWGLGATDMALDEWVRKGYRQFGKGLLVDEYGDPAYDIFLFPLYSQLCTAQKTREEVVSHELWHLVAQQSGAAVRTPLIDEGAASYASMRYICSVCPPPRSPPDIGDLFYEGAGTVVQEHVAELPNPYQAMLEKPVLERVQGAFVRFATPHIATAVHSALWNPCQRKFASYTFLPLPPLQNGTITPRSFIDACRSSGAHMLADELEGQDLTKLLQYVRRTDALG